MAKDITIHGTVVLSPKQGKDGPQPPSFRIRSVVTIRGEAIRQLANLMDDDAIIHILGERIHEEAMDTLGYAWSLDEEPSEIRRMCQDAIWGGIMH